MLKKLTMSVAMFTATYLLLSISVGDAPLFDRLYRWTSPITIAAQKAVTRLLGSGWEGSRHVGQKLFHNSVPSASRPNAGIKARVPAAPLEHIPETDRRALNDLIKDYAR